MNDQVAGFDWDDGNAVKCLKHGLTREEIEAALLNSPKIAPDPAHFADEQIFIAIGHNILGRPMFIAFTFRTIAGEVRLRPVSARYMHEKERKRYEARSENDDR